MPEIVEKCVKALMADPKFKAKNKDDSKKDAAWAVCTARHKEGKLTEQNFDAEMKVLFSDIKTYLKFDEDITSVAEQLGQNKAFAILDEHVWALRNTINQILLDDEVKDKKDKILVQLQEFAKLTKTEIAKLGDFTDQRAEVIPFTGEVESYEVVDVGDGEVQINNLPIFMLGNHRGFNYDENWAKDVAISGFEKNKSTGHLPGICIQHTYDEGGHPVPKEVKSFFDNMRVENDVIYCDTLPIDKEIARNFPYRSVEINPDTRRIDALAIHGAESVPYFKFPPVMFDEGKDTGEKKIILTFFDENFKTDKGGDKMKDQKTQDLEAKKKNFLQSIMAQVEKFFEAKGEVPKVELFTEEEVKKREEKAKEDAKKDAQTKFMEDRKQEEIGTILKDLFGENGRKEGFALAPRVKSKVESFLKSISSQSTIKFTEETGKDADKKTVEKELTQFNAIKELFTEILQAPETVLVELGEKSRFVELPNLTGKETLTEDQNTKRGKDVAAKFGAKKKEKKE